MESLDQGEIARLSDALTHAVHRAASMIDAEDYGEKLRDLVRHARELHGMCLREQERSSETWMVDELRTLCDEAGASLEQIESLLEEAGRA